MYGWSESEALEVWLTASTLVNDGGKLHAISTTQREID